MSKIFTRLPKKVARDSSKAILDVIDEYAKENSIPEFTEDNIADKYLDMPKFLDNIESRELGKYFHTFTMQRIYERGLLAKTGAVIREYEELLKPIKARVYRTQDKRMPLTEKELYLYEDAEAKEMLEELYVYREKHLFVEQHLQSLEHAIFDVSREISRRQGDFSQAERGENISKRR